MASEAVRIPYKTLFLFLLVAASIYVGFLINSGLEDALSQLRQLSFGGLVLMAALSMFSYVFRFLRWHYFLSITTGSDLTEGECSDSSDVRDQRPAWPLSAAIYFSGFTFTASPGKVGELVRSVFLKPYGVSFSRTFAMFFSERLMDLIVVACLSLLCLSMLEQYRHLSLVVCGSIFVLLLLLRSQLLTLLLHRSPLKQARDGLIEFQTLVRHLFSLCRLVIPLACGVFAWFSQGLVLYVVLSLLGVELPISLVVGVYCLSILAGAASMIPGGLGVTEGMIGILLIALGLDSATAVTAALLCRGLTLWLAIALGFMCLVLSSRLSPDNPSSTAVLSNR
jgi:uncharacterized protein (TIRG00374 family)